MKLLFHSEYVNASARIRAFLFTSSRPEVHFLSKYNHSRILDTLPNKNIKIKFRLI